MKQAQLADLAGVRLNTIHRIEKGEPTSFDMIFRLAAVLKVPTHELFRESDDADSKAVDEFLANVRGLPDTLVQSLKYLAIQLNNALAGRVADLSVADNEDLPTLSATPGVSALPGAESIAVRRLQVAAGGGALDLDEEVKSYAYFRQEWLSAKGITADHCCIIGVMGESMEPTLPQGCSILVDRSRTRRYPGGIFVVRTADGLVVKRAEEREGIWQLVSDHPAWAPIPWPADADVVGEVRWMASEF